LTDFYACKVGARLLAHPVSKVFVQLWRPIT